MTLEQISKQIAMAVQKERQRCIRIVKDEADYRAGCGAFDTSALLDALVEQLGDGMAVTPAKPQPVVASDSARTEEGEDYEEATRVLNATRQSRAHQAGHSGFLRD